MIVGAALAGADALAASLAAAADDIADLAPVHRRAGQDVIAAATIPRDTGYLESTAAVVADDHGFTLTASAPYAAKVHAHNPFFTRALAAHTDDVVRAIEEHVQTTIDHVKGA